MTQHPRTLLFTRPQGQGEDLINALQSADWRIVRQPLLQIAPFEQDNPKAFQAIKQHILNLADFDVVISVSSNASTLAVDWIDQYWPQMPEQINWYAVGPSSAKPFKNLGISMVTPEGKHSEGLLALPELQNVQDKKVLILRGLGGRELLADTLKQRGAQVHYAELYERQAIPLEKGYLAGLLSSQQIHYALITSGEMAQQLAIELNNHEAHLALHLVVPSERIKKIALTLGFKQVHVCGHLNAHSLLACLDSLPNIF